jgi:hypothetical protein
MLQSMLEDSLKLVIHNCESNIKLIYLARLVSLVCLLGSSDPTTIQSAPVTCISSTAVDTRSTISIFLCPVGNSLGLGDPSILTSDTASLHLPKCKNIANCRSVTPLVSSMHGQTQTHWAPKLFRRLCVTSVRSKVGNLTDLAYALSSSRPAIVTT